jgi:hypothetical protein
MVLYILKNPPSVDILMLPDGSGMIVKDGKPVPITKAEIEAQYTLPLAKG